jgi:hypothetical protein
MPRIKVFAVETYTDNMEALATLLRGDVTDWSDISEEQLKSIELYRGDLRAALIRKGKMTSREHILVVRELPQPVIKNLEESLSEIIDAVAAKRVQEEAVRRRREASAAEKAQKKKINRELKKLEELKQKYDNSNQKSGESA